MWSKWEEEEIDESSVEDGDTTGLHTHHTSTKGNCGI